MAIERRFSRHAANREGSPGLETVTPRSPCFVCLGYSLSATKRMKWGIAISGSAISLCQPFSHSKFT